MTIDLRKEQVRFRVKKESKFDEAELEKAFAASGFSKIQVLSTPEPG